MLHAPLTRVTISSFFITIDIERRKNRQLKFCYVPATSAAHNRLFLLRLFTVQSIFLDVYDYNTTHQGPEGVLPWWCQWNVLWHPSTIHDFLSAGEQIFRRWPSFSFFSAAGIAFLQLGRRRWWRGSEVVSPKTCCRKCVKRLCYDRSLISSACTSLLIINLTVIMNPIQFSLVLINWSLVGGGHLAKLVSSYRHS